jgi:hypothetical protein
MPLPSWINEVSSIATTVGVFLAWWQLRLSQRQATTDFEDSLAEQYRNIVHELPVGALLGEDIGETEYKAALDDFYRYIDLSNTQVFLRATRRISDSTWTIWAEGIEQHLRRPAFARAWAEIKERAQDSFHELRRLEGVGIQV